MRPPRLEMRTAFPSGGGRTSEAGARRARHSEQCLAWTTGQQRPRLPQQGPAASQGPVRVPRHRTEAISSTVQHLRDPAWPLQMFSEWLTNWIGPGECAWLLRSSISLEIEAIWVCSQARAGLARIGCDYKKQVRRECYCKENWIHVF